MLGSLLADAIRPFIDAGVDLVRTAVSWRNSTLEARTRVAVADRQGEISLAEAKLRVLVAREQLDVVTKEANLDRAHEKELAEFYVKAAEMRQRDELATRRWLFEEQRKLQREIESFRAEIQLQMAESHHRALLDSVEFGVFLQQLPVRSVPSVLLPRYAEYQRERARTPLMVIISPPEVDGDPNPVTERLPGIDTILAGRVGELLARYSGPAERIHFVDGAWKTKSIWGETAFQNLYEAFKPIPTLVLESRIEGDDIRVRFAMWLGNTRMRQGDLGVIPIPPMQGDVRPKTKGKTRPHPARKTFETTQALAKRVASHHAIAAAWFADAYHLATYGQAPLLPAAMPTLLPDADDQTVAALLGSLGDVAARLGAAGAVDPALITIAIARALAEANDAERARTHLSGSLCLWLRQNGVLGADTLQVESALGVIASVGDLEFLLAIRGVAHRVGDQEIVAAVDRVRSQVPVPELPDVDDSGETVYGKW